jgi:hypothetical protein
MRRPGGYARISGPDGIEERDSFTCCHCGAVRLVMPRERPEDIGGLCRLCMGMICPACVGAMRCDPLEKKLQRAEAAYEARRSYGLR